MSVQKEVVEDAFSVINARAIKKLCLMRSSLTTSHSLSAEGSRGSCTSAFLSSCCDADVGINVVVIAMSTFKSDKLQSRAAGTSRIPLIDFTRRPLPARSAESNWVTVINHNNNNGTVSRHKLSVYASAANDSFDGRAWGGLERSAVSANCIGWQRYNRPRGTDLREEGDIKSLPLAPPLDVPALDATTHCRRSD
ncbi:hypothetical protein EVAR_22870_1 [Eumeta japonica]|uniref:Uncharacterized protein n=1 Tax=Eumeta variegata TaxID=151549 RepID=A0A4C1UU26_EUMVA|nr:hypothetical protein EVAR_22870_1 [Eumeta japonica]